MSIKATLRKSVTSWHEKKGIFTSDVQRNCSLKVMPDFGYKREEIVIKILYIVSNWIRKLSFLLWLH